jgi:hypothetical protein
MQRVLHVTAAIHMVLYLNMSRITLLNLSIVGVSQMYSVSQLDFKIFAKISSSGHFPEGNTTIISDLFSLLSVNFALPFTTTRASFQHTTIILHQGTPLKTTYDPTLIRPPSLLVPRPVSRTLPPTPFLQLRLLIFSTHTLLR